MSRIAAGGQIGDRRDDGQPCPLEKPELRRNTSRVRWKSDRARPLRLSLFDRSSRFSTRQAGLPIELFLGILSTSSGSARAISRRAIRSIKSPLPGRDAQPQSLRHRPWARPSRLPDDGNIVSLSKVRDEEFHICCRTAQEARRAIERNCGEPAAVEGFPQTCTKAAVRSHRTGRTSRDRCASLPGIPFVLTTLRPDSLVRMNLASPLRQPRFCQRYKRPSEYRPAGRTVIRSRRTPCPGLRLQQVAIRNPVARLISAGFPMAVHRTRAGSRARNDRDSGIRI